MFESSLHTLLRVTFAGALCATLAGQASGQIPAEASVQGIAANFLVDGETHQISNVDLALEMARRERLRPRGQSALDDLIHRTLVARAAEKAGLTPSQDEIDGRILELEENLRGHGMDLEQFLAEKQLSRRAFEQDYIGLSIAHESLVMHEAGLRSRSEVTKDLLELWLEESRTNAGVVVDAAKLSPGEVARIGKLSVSMADLGEVLRQNATAKQCEAAVRQIVVRRLLNAAARSAEIEVSPQEMRAEVESRRARIESDPTLQGAKFEDLLIAQGTTIEQLRESPVIRAQVQRRKLVEKLNPREQLDAYLDEHRAEVLLDHGPRRRVHIIQIRAAETPTKFVPLDFEAASAEAAAVRTRILKEGISFGVAARIHSEDPASKPNGGDVGMLSYRSDAVPREVLDEAFKLAPFLISQPIRADSGYYLTMATDVEDDPNDDVLRQRLLEAKSRKYVLELLDDAQLRVASR